MVRGKFNNKGERNENRKKSNSRKGVRKKKKSIKMMALKNGKSGVEKDLWKGLE